MIYSLLGVSLGVSLVLQKLSVGEGGRPALLPSLMLQKCIRSSKKGLFDFVFDDIVVKKPSRGVNILENRKPALYNQKAGLQTDEILLLTWTNRVLNLLNYEVCFFFVLFCLFFLIVKPAFLKHEMGFLQSNNNNSNKTRQKQTNGHIF